MRANSVWSTKGRRVADGHPLRVLELCSGCGGLALGFEASGYELAAHVEIDQAALATYTLNFEPRQGVDIEEWAKPRDMVSQTMAGIVEAFSLGGRAETSFDVVAAGLPCQAFARIGRS